MSDEKDKSVKQGSVTPRRLRIGGFRGAFLDTRFDDKGVSTEPVTPETEDAIKKQFPRAKIEVLRAGPNDTPNQTA